MPKHLLLVDYENVHKIDLSSLDDSYRAIIFVGGSQNPPKAARNRATAHRFNRVDFQKIVGSGKNALDFHIAFHLGRTFEVAPDTTCVVISRDKRFDPLLAHLNGNGLSCRRVESFDELLRESARGRVDIARSGIGVAVRSGLPHPDVSSANAVKEAVLGARSIAYSSGPSGFYLEELFRKMGILDQVKARSGSRHPVLGWAS